MYILHVLSVWEKGRMREEGGKELGNTYNIWRVIFEDRNYEQLSLFLLYILTYYHLEIYNKI